ncbi:SGNH/GDSL hydrolase family protein [Achromobacter anxifer]|uniref:SGNH/GDSL hydrolase family protein n=1 Tax=Achromobacter anxifer TaxID=1287737 RepID=UPI0023F64DA1|nr:SGNH/GDSL hydrolase family protein [Achromobacter anxifer]MDF8362549.1 SGNH/GDSL hydrolase family protein [Achromobacter anxifer]
MNRFNPFSLVSTATLAAGLAVLAPAVAAAQPPVQADAARSSWVSSWFASPQPLWEDAFVLPTEMPAELRGQTLRQTLMLSLGGPRLRVVLSNRYGTQPLEIGAASVALAVGGSKIRPGSSRGLAFGGRPGVTVAPGAQAVSDPVELPVSALAELAVSLYFPQATPVTTFHWGAQQSGALVRGDATAAAELPDAQALQGRAFLAGVWVESPKRAPVVVAFGDSLTDGNGSTPGANRRWPDYLARRLAPQGIGVANAGISGARVWGDKMGVNAMARFDADVLSQPGVRTVVMMMGINDIGWPDSGFAPDDAPMTAARLSEGYRQLAEAARLRGVRIVGGTIAPYEGSLHGTPLSGHYNPAKDAVRLEVNRWIRESGVFDAVADFDAVLRDPAHPARLLPAYDSGDNLHPNDAGYQAMAQALDMATLFGD